MSIKPVHWFVLLCLAFLWGSSYLMVELALAVWRPQQIAGLRIILAAIVLLVAALLGRSKIPRDLRSWGYFLGMAAIGNCLPFFLISWGQQHVESGLAGIIAASTPLFVLVFAHFVLPDERLRRGHALAFLLGFSGIVVLMGPDSLAALGGSGERLLAQLAILIGAVCYAVATVVARLIPPASPLVVATSVMILASGVMAPFVINAVAALPEAPTPALLALGFLGVLGTGVASILYFYLVAQTGARFTSLLNYLVPIWAIVLGSMFLGETLPISTWLALILILGGLILISRSGHIAAHSEGRDSDGLT